MKLKERIIAVLLAAAVAFAAIAASGCYSSAHLSKDDGEPKKTHAAENNEPAKTDPVIISDDPGGTQPGDQTGVPDPDAFIEEYKQNYGVASTEEFISCEGSDVKDLPDSLLGYVSSVKYDIDSDSVDEVMILAVVKNDETLGEFMQAELYAFDGNGYVLQNSENLVIEYCTASYIYFYMDPLDSAFYILLDQEGYGAYTGINYVTATAYTVSREGFADAGRWDLVYGMYEEDVVGGLESINAPFAKYSASFDNTDQYECYFPICEIEHTVEYKGEGFGYEDRIHKQRIVPFSD